MKQKYFRIPFAQNGDKQSIVENSDPQGFVSYEDGFTHDYEKDLMTDANAKPPERETFNELLNGVTENIKQYQENGFPEFISSADNNGVPFSYSKGATVYYNSSLYVSVVDNNTTIPGIDDEKWQPFLFERATEEEAAAGTDNESIITPKTLNAGLSNYQKYLKPFLLPVGAILDWPLATPPDGWLEANGQGFDKSLYPELAKIFPSGVLPDLRGVFSRGWDNGRGIDPGRSLLSYQDDAIRNITGSIGASVRVRHSESGAMYYGNQRATSHSQTSSDGDVIKFDASRIVPTAHENRPKSVALMRIIKTDLADDEKGDVPTNVIVSPSSINGGVGGSVQLTTTVLPASLAGSYPVSYVSSDTSVCTVDTNGLVTLAGAGTATIIASISTGLATTIEVNSNILLTNLSIGTIPTLTAGDKVGIPLTGTPSNYTEPVIFDSSNQNVAIISNNELMAVGAGSAVITATGAVSGVTANKTITVNAAVIVETYVQIDNNLSDLDNVAIARTNLGLGELSTKDSLAAGDVKAVPLSDRAITAGTDLNTVTSAGQYYQNVTSNATIALNYPEAVAGALIVYKTGVDDGCRQEYMPYNSTKVYRRYAFGNPLNFSEWDEY